MEINCNIILMIFILFGTTIGVASGCSTGDLPSHPNTKRNASAHANYELGNLISYHCIDGYLDEKLSSMIYKCTKKQHRIVVNSLWEKQTKVINCTKVFCKAPTNHQYTIYNVTTHKPLEFTKKRYPYNTQFKYNCLPKGTTMTAQCRNRGQWVREGQYVHLCMSKSVSPTEEDSTSESTVEQLNITESSSNPTSIYNTIESSTNQQESTIPVQSSFFTQKESSEIPSVHNSNIWDSMSSTFVPFFYSSSDIESSELETTLSPTKQPISSRMSTIYAEITSIKASIQEQSLLYLDDQTTPTQTEWYLTVFEVNHSYPDDLPCDCQVLESAYNNLLTDIRCEVYKSGYSTNKPIDFNHTPLVTLVKKFNPNVYEAKYSVAIGSTTYLFLGFVLMYILILDIPRIVEHARKYKVFNRMTKKKFTEK